MYSRWMLASTAYMYMCMYIYIYILYIYIYTVIDNYAYVYGQDIKIAHIITIHIDLHTITLIYIYIHIWLVIWNIFDFPIYWEYSSQLTNIFQRGWNHQPDVYIYIYIYIYTYINNKDMTSLSLGSNTFRAGPRSAREKLPTSRHTGQLDAGYCWDTIGLCFIYQL